MDSAIVLSAFGIFSATVLGLFKIIATQTQAVVLLAKNIEENTAISRDIVEETRNGNREAALRNGHLGEQNIKIAKLVTRQNADVKGIRNTNDKIVDLLKKSKDQHVETQIVDVQTVNNRE